MRLRLPLSRFFTCFLFSTIAFISCSKSLEEERTVAEIKTIENFIEGKGYINYGSVYIRDSVPPKGYQISRNDTISFRYKGYTLDGNVFETNIIREARKANLDTIIRSFEPLVVVAGRGNLIDGLDIGMLFLHEGEIATVIFPSSLGFGKNYIGPIPPRSPLAYYIEIIKVNRVGI